MRSASRSSILSRVGGLEQVRAICERHHEHLDGSGYPNGLTGSALTVHDRLLAAAARYHGSLEPRPYRAALDPDRGLAPFFKNWQKEQSLDKAVRRTYGMTLSGFESYWQQRTRRRYGALALAGNVTVGGLLMLIVILPLYIARRRRDRRRMAELRAADVAAEVAARKSLLALLLGGDDGPRSGDETTGAPPN